MSEQTKTHIADYPAIILFWVLFAIILLQFITRYVFNDSVGWTEELARYVLITLTFVGAITCVRKGSHIFLEFLHHALPDVISGKVKITARIISAGFYLFAAYLSIELIERLGYHTMVSLDIPKSILYGLVGICFLSMAVVELYSLITRPIESE